MNCNIDAKGKRSRLMGGLIAVSIGLLLAGFWAIPSGATIAWTICVVLFMIGSFMIFEARAGWCALRAMGFKTRV
jgi:hypothetical protein